MKAADLIQMGLVVRPALFGKAPGVSATEPSFTAAEAVERDRLLPPRWNVIVGRQDIGLRSGVVDVETDVDKDTGEMVGEASLRAAGITMPPGPWMRTDSGSIHRLVRLTVPEGMEPNLGADLFGGDSKVDVPWQFLALDGDLRTWHDTHLPIPEAPAALVRHLVQAPMVSNVAAGTWDGEGYGTKAALRFLEGRVAAIRDHTVPGWEQGDGAGWNKTFYSAVKGAAGLVAAGHLDAAYAEEALLGACDDPDEAAAVFHSAWKKGLAVPWSVEPPEPVRQPPAPGTRFRLDALLDMDLPEIRWAVPDMLPEGLSLLAGPPKMGKSWLVLDVAISVAAGRPVLGRDVVAGDVLYMALEDNAGRLQRRSRILLGKDPGPSRLELWTRAGTLTGTLLPEIEEWLDAQPDPRLVIIDTLGRVQESSAWVDSKDGGYADAVAALAGLQDMAAKRNVAVVVITHTKKGWSLDGDPLEAVLGSQGYAGTADAILVLRRERAKSGGELFVTGREVDEELTEKVWFDRQSCRWFVGDEDYPSFADQVLDFLEQRDKKGEQPNAWTMTYEQLAHALKRRESEVRATLEELEANGQVSSKPRPGRGRPGKLWGPAAVLPPGLQGAA